MLQKIRILLIALMILGMITACHVDTAELEVTPEETEPALDLDGTHWDLISMGGLDVSTAGMTLEFGDENEIKGFDGCNEFGTTYQLTGHTIQMSNSMWQTLVACLGGTYAMGEDGQFYEISSNTFNEWADEYIATLQTAERIYLNKNQLLVESRDKDLIFSTPRHTSLTGTIWSPSKISLYSTVNGPHLSYFRDRDLFIRLEEDSVIGNAACNSFHGDVAIHDDQLSFGPLFVAEKICDDHGENARHASVMNMIETTQKYEILRDRLLFFNDEGEQIAEFFPLNSAILQDTLYLLQDHWTLQQYYVGDQAVVSVPEALIYFEIGTDNTIAGHAGCNLFYGPIGLTEKTLFASPRTTTDHVCSSDLMQHETAVLDLLAQARTFILGKEVLLLIDQDGAISAQFTRVVPPFVFPGQE